MHPRHWRPCGPTCTSLFYIHYFKEENSAAGGGLHSTVWIPATCPSAKTRRCRVVVTVPLFFSSLLCRYWWDSRFLGPLPIGDTANHIISGRRGLDEETRNTGWEMIKEQHTHTHLTDWLTGTQWEGEAGRTIWCEEGERGKFGCSSCCTRVFKLHIHLYIFNVSR